MWCFSNKEFVLNSTCQKGINLFWFIFSLSNMWQCPLATNSFFSFFPNISDIWLVYILGRSRRLKSHWGSLSRCCGILCCCSIHRTPWRKQIVNWNIRNVYLCLFQLNNLMLNLTRSSLGPAKKISELKSDFSILYCCIQSFFLIKILRSFIHEKPIKNFSLRQLSPTVIWDQLAKNNI